MERINTYHLVSHRLLHLEHILVIYSFVILIAPRGEETFCEEMVTRHDMGRPVEKKGGNVGG